MSCSRRGCSFSSRDPSSKSMVILQSFLSILLTAAAAASAALLKNGDFESPPSNINPGHGAALLLLRKNNTIPGWSFNGTVYYVTASPSISLPDNGHAVQLGPNGVISQTFKLTSYASHYILTFTVAPISENCTALTQLNVSLRDNDDPFLQSYDMSAVFAVQGKYGRRSWESHACYLGYRGGEGYPMILELQSQPMEADPSFICEPVVDTVILKRFPPAYGYETELVNGGFEEGPILVSNSSEGILLGESQDFMNSPLLQWAVAGTVKYVNKKYYLVPEGNAAIEITSVLGAVRTILLTREGSSYTLRFVMGIPFPSCAGELLLAVQAGSTSQNFSLPSNGTGYSKNFSMRFKAESNLTSIGFMTLQGGETSDHVICGPLIDRVIVSGSFRVIVSGSFRLSIGLKMMLLLLVMVLNIGRLEGFSLEIYG